MQVLTDDLEGPVPASYELALEQLRPELEAVTESELVCINVNIALAAVTVTSALDRLRPLRPQLIDLRHFDLAQFDKLQTYTLALLAAHMRFNVVTRPVDPKPELIEEATGLRDTLYADVQTLVRRGILQADTMREIRTASGHAALASDLGHLAVLLQLHWERVHVRSAVLAPEIERATLLSSRIRDILAGRHITQTTSLQTATLDRQRAYTLFFRAYVQARRVVGYLRWREGDVDTLVPSLHAGRNKGKRRPRPDPAALSPVDAVD